MQGLTQSELEHFHAQGWLKKANVIDSETLDALRQSIDSQLDAECRSLIAKGEMVESQAHFDANFDKRLGLIVRDLQDFSVAQKTILRAMQDLFLTGRVQHAPIDEAAGEVPLADTLLACIRHAGLVDCIRSIIGDDILGSSTFRIRAKVPHWEPGDSLPYFPGHVPWHQDAGYALAHCDEHLTVTCWVPLVPATETNGCMCVYPYPFENGVLPHLYGRDDHYLWIDPDDLPAREPVVVELEVGDVLFMTNMTPHASFDNRSDTTRWSMDLRYAPIGTPSNVDVDPAEYEGDVPPYRLACNPHEGDFIVRDTKNPTREVRDGKTFAEMRIRWAKQHRRFGRGWPRAEVGV